SLAHLLSRANQRVMQDRKFSSIPGVHLHPPAVSGAGVPPARVAGLRPARGVAVPAAPTVIVTVMRTLWRARRPPHVRPGRPHHLHATARLLPTILPC